MPQHSASDRREVRAAEKRAATADANRRTVIIALADSSAGRQWLWEELEAARIFHTTWDADPTRSAYLEGMRAQGLRLLGQVMQNAPEQFIQMMRESNERNSSSERPRGQDGDGGDQGREPDDDDRDDYAG